MTDQERKEQFRQRLRKKVLQQSRPAYQVAKLAGLPDEVTERAKQVLKTLDAASQSNKRVTQLDFEALEAMNSPAVPSEMMDKLNALDVETLTPIEALNFLYELKKTLDN